MAQCGTYVYSCSVEELLYDHEQLSESQDLSRRDKGRPKNAVECAGLNQKIQSLNDLRLRPTSRAEARLHVPWMLPSTIILSQLDPCRPLAPANSTHRATYAIRAVAHEFVANVMHAAAMPHVLPPNNAPGGHVRLSLCDCSA